LFTWCTLAHSPWVYIHNSTPISLQLFKPTSISLQLNFLITRTLSWPGLQSWTLSWLNFFRNSVFKLNQILWSFSWLRLFDLNQLEPLIFILLGLDLNRVLYLGILLGSDSFRSPPSTWIDPFYLTRIQLYLLVELVLYKLDVPVYKKVSYPKQRSLLVLHVFVLPNLLTRVFTRSGNSLPYFLLGRLPRFLPKIVPDSLLELLPRTLPESLPKSYLSVLPRALPESYLGTYPIGLTRPYPSAYPAG
jgi:hypothetical protein